ncbi:MAG: BamA/TamA family outer membrane protein [Pirellulales bacterium]
MEKNQEDPNEAILALKHIVTQYGIAQRSRTAVGHRATPLRLVAVMCRRLLHGCIVGLVVLSSGCQTGLQDNRSPDPWIINGLGDRPTLPPKPVDDYKGTPNTGFGDKSPSDSMRIRGQSPVTTIPVPSNPGSTQNRYLLNNPAYTSTLNQNGRLPGTAPTQTVQYQLPTQPGQPAAPAFNPYSQPAPQVVPQNQYGAIPQQPTQSNYTPQQANPAPYNAPGYNAPGYNTPNNYGVAPYGNQGVGAANPYAGTVPSPPPSVPSMGYGGAGSYAPSPTAMPPSPIAPGATGYIDGQAGMNSMVAPGAVAPGVDPTTGLSFNSPYQPLVRETPVDVYVQEGRTGRIVLGGSVNSDLGVGGQLIIDERNFDYRRLPTSWGDLFAGKAFRGDGQNFRAELMPGNRVQRYTVNFTQPHLFGYSPISFSVGGFLFTRQFRDWTEQRLGGRLALGYDITRDLSITTELNMQDVNISSPRVLGVPELDRVLGSNDLYTGRIRLAHDTRDSPFMATEGHYLEMMYDQVFGEFDYPRGQVNYSRYFLIRERPDQGGRHTLALTSRFGISGADTPVFENYFMGGYSTLRGFSFRGASPKTGDVQVGGRMQFLGSAEYLFPLTADDMLRGIVFCDYGAISKDLDMTWDDYRISPGFGIRVNVPALGPAPLAFDFAFPVKYANTDDRQIFSFFMGFTR